MRDELRKAVRRDKTRKVKAAGKSPTANCMAAAWAATRFRKNYGERRGVMVDRHQI
jgi:hypothetical protein